MKRINFISKPLLVLTSVAALGLAACSGTVDGYTAAPTIAKRPVAQWTVSRLDLHFEPGTARLATGEEARLVSALALEDPTRPVRVVARTTGADTTPALAIERASALRTIVETKGFKLQFQSQGAVVAENPKERDIGALFIGRYEVSVPGCPDWRKPMVADFSNKESSNLGCANALNLAQMLVDPGDLNKGDPLGSANGAREALAVNKYRIGESPWVTESDQPTRKPGPTLNSKQ